MGSFCYNTDVTNIRKSNRGHIYLIAVLCFVLLAVIGVGAKLYFHSAVKQSPLQEIRKQVTATHDNIAVNDGAWPAQMGSGMPVVVPDFNFSISSQRLPSLYFGLKDKANGSETKSPYDIEPIIEKTLARDGYSSLYVGPTTRLFTNNSLAQEEKCLSIYDGQQTVLTLTCYQAQEAIAVAQTLKPFVGAYTKAVPGNIDTETYFGPVTIKSHNTVGVIGPSQAAGYDIAEMIIAQKDDTNKQIALFYNKQGGAWQYVTQASDEFGFTCGSFLANPDVRSAMHGQICLSNNGQVKFGTSERALQ